MKSIKITTKKTVKEYLIVINSIKINDPINLYDLLKRQDIKIEHLEYFTDISYDKEVKEEVEINSKYEGYINKSLKDAEKLKSLENKKIPENIDYYKIHNLASEAKQKLTEIKPTSLDQALRISGVNPSDISILSVYLKKEYHHE